MSFTHPSCLSSVCPSLYPYLKIKEEKRSSGSVERTNQSRDPEGYTYQSSDPEECTYQSSTLEGCIYQSSAPEGCTYQSSAPEGCTYQSSAPEGCTYPASRRTPPSRDASPSSNARSHLSLPSSTSGHGIKELTFKFSGSAAGLLGDSSPFLGVDSIEGHNRESGKGFPTTGPRIEAGNVVVHRGLHVTRPLVVACVLSGIGIVCRWTLKFTVRYVVVIGLDIDHGVWSGKDDGLVWTEGTRLICASFGSTRLIYASFESTRLICAFLGITRLIGVSFGITRLICAFYGTTRLLCRVRVQRGANRREAGRMREVHMDASGFLYASADVFCENFWFCDFELMT
ncbi:NBS-LRR type resistance protein [Cucumis melo var. makuwa]|uniref:NBS-LRR type resistance protein n=1 Tax=Cucumis melo var. makuwa TaxID=1194695 RepID=A0A5A7SQK5_CUCMM|nr:NBS-LRR type resistance protein [Cucumis melo var. makuwa]